MQLKIKRSQRDGMMGAIIFALDARLHLNSDEAAAVEKYKLGSKVLYNSEASQKHLARAEAHHAAGDADKGWGGTMQYMRSLGSVALAAMKLNITVNSLIKGQHIECKSLDEIMGAEQALIQSCENIKAYLITALSFNGQEQVVEFEQPANA